jgi:glycosyltransferase involved in cell wall biosynthesis
VAAAENQSFQKISNLKNRMTYPKISLVTACHNHQKYIGKTIDSILSQDYPNLQYIVIDDGSTDGSWEIIKKYQDRLYRCEKMDGQRDNPTAALNQAFAETDGEIMGWLNSDDILLPTSLFTIAEIFSQLQEVEWLTGMATTINSESKIVNSKLNAKNIYDYLSGNWKTIQQESTFWRRGLWQKTGAELADSWAFDAELWTRFFLQTEHYNVNAPLGAFRSGESNASLDESGKYSRLVGEALAEMRKNSSRKLKTETAIYAFFRRIRPLLALIPNDLILKNPYFRKISYRIISYSFPAKSWEIKQINPFKSIIL